MPFGPSHGARGGSSSSRSRRGGGGGNLFGAIVGGMIGGILSSGSRRREQHYHDHHDHHDHHDNYESHNEPSTPSRKKPTAFLILAIIMAVVTAFTFAIRNGFIRQQEKNALYVEKMVADQKEWKDHYALALSQQRQIDEAIGEEKNQLIKERTHFVTKATFTKGYSAISVYGENPQVPTWYEFEKINDYSYYFIVYEFNYTTYDEEGRASTEKDVGTTYAEYRQGEVPNGEIDIVYYIDNNGKTASCDLFFINSTLSLEEGEYGFKNAFSIANKELAKNTIFVIIGEFVLLALFVVLYILKLKKYYKLVKEDEVAYSQKQQAEVSEAQAKAEAAQKDADKKNRVCAFCGSTVPDGEDSCPACGSRTFE